MTEHHQESHKQNRQKQKQRHVCRMCAGPGFWDGLDCLMGFLFFFDFLKEHMFYKAVMSRLEKTAVGVGRRPDKPVKKRQKGAKKRRI